MAVVAIYSLKGGVGKTSFAVNLAWSAARRGSNTLLWDLDPQWAASFVLGHEPQPREKAHRLYTDDQNPEDLLLATGVDRLDLLPADKSLRDLDRTFLLPSKRKRMKQLLKGLPSDYDRIVLDCPPGLTETSDQMMRVADLIIAPVIPSPLSERALAEVADHLTTQHGGRAPILPVFSMVDRRRSLHREALAANPRWPVIPMASAVEQMAVRRAPIGAFASTSPAAIAFDALWIGIERKLSKMGRSR